MDRCRSRSFQLRTTRSCRNVCLVLGGAVFAAAVGACAAFAPPSIGVTTGGAEDIGYARQTIESGGIPSPDWITVEGFFSEHSIAAPTPADPGLLYATAQTSWNADFDALTPQVTIQIGFGTNVDPATFERADLDLCLVIDRSGSMEDYIDERTRTSRLDAVKIAVDRVLARLTAADRVSVVAFADEAETLLEPVSGHNALAVKSALDGVVPQGATDLARGLSAGYQLLDANRSAERSPRLLVFTDANITAGLRDAEDLITVMQAYASGGIGATIAGVGTDFGQQLAYDISQVRGGNFVYLNDYDRIVSVFDEDFDFLMSPIAYDVRLSAQVPVAFDVVDAFGLPDIDVSRRNLALTIPSLFFSQREGGAAIFVRLRPGALVDFSRAINAGAIELTYQLADGTTETQSLSLSLPANLDPAAATPYFRSDTARRAVLLLNTVLALKNACLDAYNGWLVDPVTDAVDYHYPSTDDLRRAEARLTEFLPYFDQLAAGLEDRPSPTSRALSEERALIQALLTNVQQDLGIYSF